MRQIDSRWASAKLGDICAFKYGKSLPAAARNGGQYAVYGSNGVVGWHDQSLTDGPAIIIGRKGSYGEINYSNGPCWPIDTAYFVDQSATDQDLRWLSYRLAALGLNSMNKSAAVPGLNREDAYRLQLTLPPLPEQRRIAAILDQANALRAKRREALAQLESLKASIFVDMFGDPATNARGWPTHTLKELGKVSTGGTPPSYLEGMFGGEIPFITPGDLESDRPIRRTVTLAGAQEAGTVRAGATFVCCIGATIGKMGMATVRSSFNQQLNAVDWFADAVDDQYGLAALQFFKPTIIAWGASTTLPILKKSTFEKVSIPVPPLAIQREFSSRSRAVAQLAVKLQEALDVASTLFAALQDRAFKGDF